MRIQGQNFGTERAVRFQLLEKVYNYPTHIHQYAELAIPLSGELEIVVEGRHERLSPGQAAFVFPLQPHSYISNEKNKIAIFVFAPSMIRDFFNITHGKVGRRAVFTPKAATLCFLRERIIDKNELELFDVKGSIYLILSDLMSEVELISGSKNTNLSAAIVEYVNEHIQEDITLSAIAKELGYNPNYLSTRIQEIFGINLCSLIASVRADKAKYLLYETTKTGLEICFECGFGSERSFHRQFKAITGYTPKEYRNNIATITKINHGIIKHF